MHTERMTVNPTEARALYRAYKQHMHYSSPLDREIMRCYQLIAQGRLVIRALESIVKAGTDTDGFPKLGIVRADASQCFLRLYDNGSARMSSTMSPSNSSHRQYVDFPRGSFPVSARGHYWRAESIVPPCPLQYRPRRGLANYHILFEAEWHRRIPVDPLLLRRVGKADLWAVLAAWDVTEVERAVLQSRIAN